MMKKLSIFLQTKQKSFKINPKLTLCLKNFSVIEKLQQHDIFITFYN